jgi:arsenate reductase
MAEGILNARFGDRVEARSAGTHPARAVSHFAVLVMHEIDIDISAQKPKHVSEFEGVPFDIYVTLCGGAAEECAHLPWLKPQIHVGFDDPMAATGETEEILGVYRRVRDEILGRLPKALAVL